MPVKWALACLVVGTSVVLISPQELTNCDWLLPSNNGCVKEIECQDTATVLRVWESCEKDTELFTIENKTISLAPDCEYAYQSNGIYLTEKLDAEDSVSSKSCSFKTQGYDIPKLFFDVLDVNEFPPYPYENTTPIMEVNINENTPPYEIARIQYSDDDKDETATLESFLVSTEYKDTFELTTESYNGATNSITFSFKTLKELDFEGRAFYKVEYRIVSKDEMGTEMGNNHTFYVYVKDVPDNPPFWSEIVPFYELDECKEEDELFQVTALDRDVEVNYDIKYSIAGGSEYFEIDEDTGMVSRYSRIDREELLENGISSFSLAINATEYNGANVGEKPNSNQQVSIITILDCNDETPEFNNNAYEIEIDEVTASSGDQVIDLYIVVKDMDEGDNGTFTLETNQPADQVSISPTKGKQTQEVKLTALYKADNSLFDYEKQSSTPIIIEITATEIKDTSHKNTSTVTIKLRDVNDVAPSFSQNKYSANVMEGTPENMHVLKVEADDQDVSPKFGNPSVRYTLQQSCSELDVDPITGNVTLARVLDFEDNDKLIECTVTAKDENGTGLVNEEMTIIAISVIDVVDETPRFETPLDPMDIPENSPEGTLVGTFTVEDLDAGASVLFSILEFRCSDGTLTADVTGWFSVTEDAADPPNFNGKVEVGNMLIDREMCKEVTLLIQATDDNTDAGYESSVTESFVITIEDEIDEPPHVECENSACTGITVDEDDEMNPSDASVLVFNVVVSDPDEEDIIYLSLSDGGDVVYLSKENVTVQAGSVETVEVWTKEGARIDRETQANINIEIMLTDSKSNTASKKVTVKVNDLNDKRPVIDAGLCDGPPLEIEEDDGSREKNGTLIGTISATDADKEAPHNSVRYMMLNDQIPDSKNTWNPFRIDEETGDVKILLIDRERALDREQFATWELLFRAYDGCNASLSCAVLPSTPECKVTVNVKDVNDHSPHTLTWKPNEPVTVTDFLQKDEDIGYLFSAIDEDEGENATLSYTVIGTYSNNSDINMDLFRAVDEEFSTVSCRLYANENFEGKNYTGAYNVVLEAMDGGNRSTEFNITLYVEDANDEIPIFVFDGCLGADENNIIKMEENAYTPGENGEPDKMEVKCGGPNGNDFVIKVYDADVMNDNKAVRVRVDMDNSTVEDLGDDVTSQVLLSYWSLEPNDCVKDCRLKITHLINREEGSAYNLSLHVQNTAEGPVKESWSWVRVVVTNKMEFDPYFCANGNCSQVVYMYENDADAYAVFDIATDEDNNGVSPGDDEYDDVYYFIVGGDKDYFSTASITEAKIVLKNMPNGLDREAKDEYTLKLLATNDEGQGGAGIGDAPRNDTLNVIIRVGDVNDEKPVFSKDVIFTSFMENNQKEDRITTIEAKDRDLNETLTYEMLDDLQWFETNFNPEAPFKIERKDNRSAYLTINFDPKGMTQGYCNFTLRVEDLYNHWDETVVKVYVINEDYQVAMYFSNEVEEIQNKSKQIEEIYSSVYQYACTIDSIAPTQDSTGQNLVGKTTVYMHFIDEEKNEPVDDKIILDLSDSADVMTQLINRLNLIGIQLDSVDSYFPPTHVKGSQEKIRELQILLGVVTLVLGLLLTLLAAIYTIRTKKLQRKIKVLSTNTFGSKDEGLNQMGLDVTSVPGSNYLAKDYGNHNPVFSESGGLEFKNEGTESISSGDSVLVGVEDNPEFKSYSAKGLAASSSKGFENPSYGNSIDDASFAPPGVVGGMKGNPLLNLGGLTEDPGLNDKSTQNDNDVHSVEHQDDMSLGDENIKSNFSFL